MPRKSANKKVEESDEEKTENFNKDEILEAFEYFTGGKDQIDTNELKYILTTFGDPMTEEEVIEIFKITQINDKQNIKPSQYVEEWAE